MQRLDLPHRLERSPCDGRLTGRLPLRQYVSAARPDAVLGRVVLGVVDSREPETRSGSSCDRPGLERRELRPLGGHAHAQSAVVRIPPITWLLAASVHREPDLVEAVVLLVQAAAARHAEDLSAA